MRSVSIFAGSVYGNAQHVAEEAKRCLKAKGLNVTCLQIPKHPISAQRSRL
jgi:flavodoxin